MNDQSIIKLIGHRPVYRVIRDSVSGFLVGITDDFRQILPESPLLDRGEWQPAPGGLCPAETTL